MKKQQSGFTLIELIIVIVILGILAVTAAPRFIDISSDATGSTLQGVRAALQGGSQLIYAKSAVAGEQKNAAAGDLTSQVVLGTGTVETDYGYPDADTTISNAVLDIWIDISDENFTLIAGAGSASSGSPASGSFAISPSPAPTTNDYSATGSEGSSCHVLYTEATDANTSPVVTAVIGSC